MKKYRQGDVLLVKIAALPKNTKTVQRDNGRVILAYGEVTGHAHAVVGEADLFEVEGVSDRFLHVLADEGAQLVHEEHGTVTLDPGVYIVRRQYEWSDAQEPIRVSD